MSLDAEMLRYAENLWRRFPELVLSLGSPYFEDDYGVFEDVHRHQRIHDTGTEKVIEIRLCLSRRSASRMEAFRREAPPDARCSSPDMARQQEDLKADVAKPDFPMDRPRQHQSDSEVQQGLPEGPATRQESGLAIRRLFAVPNVKTQGSGPKAPAGVARRPDLDRLAGVPVSQSPAAHPRDANQSVVAKPPQISPQSTGRGFGFHVQAPATGRILAPGSVGGHQMVAAGDAEPGSPVRQRRSSAEPGSPVRQRRSSHGAYMDSKGATLVYGAA